MALPECYGPGRSTYMSPMSRRHRDKAGASFVQVYSNSGGFARM
jgi:hypothetical protein